MIDLNKIDFESLREKLILPLDKEKVQDVEELIPARK